MNHAFYMIRTPCIVKGPKDFQMEILEILFFFVKFLFFLFVLNVE